VSNSLEKADFTPGKLSGASPSDDRYYVVLFFDISNTKKYRSLIKLLKSYSTRIQKSVFEAYLKSTQIKKLIKDIEKMMTSKQYYDPSDNIRIYRIAGNCHVTIFGSSQNNIPEENIFV
jgi:CRISPR-associated protein Cas2